MPQARHASLWCAVVLGMMTLCASGSGFRAAQGHPAREKITIESDGWRIMGDLVVPESTAPLPAVILLNKAAGSRTAYRALATHLARRGVASLAVDLRGHGESINRGKFIPGKNLEILKDSEHDVLAAVNFLKKDKRIDPVRIGFVGASYSGELMMAAGREGGFGAAYVGLSPGSLSDDSIAAIDQHGLPWLLVVSRNERFLKEVAQALRDQSRTAEFLEVSGTAHASDLLSAHPDLAERIAVWFQYRLVQKNGIAVSSTR